MRIESLKTQIIDGEQIFLRFDGSDWVLWIEPANRHNGTQTYDGWFPRRYKKQSAAKGALTKMLGPEWQWEVDHVPPRDAIKKTPEDLGADMEGYFMTTVYDSLDIPSIYVVTKGEESFFVYWLGDFEKGSQRRYAVIAFSHDEQKRVEAHEMCLRDMLFSKPFRVVTHDCSKPNNPVCHVEENIDAISYRKSEYWPEKGLLLSRETLFG
jgi:hypothetical protein